MILEKSDLGSSRYAVMSDNADEKSAENCRLTSGEVYDNNALLLSALPDEGAAEGKALYVAAAEPPDDAGLRGADLDTRASPVEGVVADIDARPSRRSLVILQQRSEKARKIFLLGIWENRVT